MSTAGRPLPASNRTPKVVPLPRRSVGRPSVSNDELLENALNLFLEVGFERTSVDAIAAATRMAKRTIYLRYPDKLTLFKAALQKAIDEWIIPVEDLRALETENLEETLLKVAETLLANVMSPAGLRLLRITNAESARTPEIGAYTYQQGTERTLVYLADLLRRWGGTDDGKLTNANEAALGLMYLAVCGPPVMAAWGVTLDRATIDRHMRYCVRLFLYGFVTRPSELRPSQPLPNVEPPSPAPEAATARDPKVIEDENRRLRRLLVEAHLENAALRESLQRS